MPLKPSHNLLVRGSNPCGGTWIKCDYLLIAEKTEETIEFECDEKESSTWLAEMTPNGLE